MWKYQKNKDENYYLTKIINKVILEEYGLTREVITSAIIDTKMRETMQHISLDFVVIKIQHFHWGNAPWFPNSSNLEFDISRFK